MAPRSEDEASFYTPSSVRTARGVHAMHGPDVFADAHTDFMITSEIATQTKGGEVRKKPISPRQVIYGSVLALAALGWIVGICGMSALSIKQNSFCFQTSTIPEIDVPGGVACLPGGGSFGVFIFAYVLEAAMFIGLVLVLKYNEMTHYRHLLLTLLNMSVQITILSTDLVLTFNHMPQLDTEASAAAAGNTMLLIVNYTLIILLGCAEKTFIGRIQRAEEWPELPKFNNPFGRFRRRKAPQADDDDAMADAEESPQGDDTDRARV
eukprot:comp14290_c0_seq1/m.10299 comp14290_c0_seq1/g.10299  ORF comp14290_c0_seq1/g.10299 comp14290_c0_seq1/m.10299 type:complete len:266 (-) comp14290_c0_seq1:547-1344(-)